MTDSKEVVSKEPWWEVPPKAGEDEMSCKWGWLIFYADASFDFDSSTRPTDEEIKNRKGCRLLD